MSDDQFEGARQAVKEAQDLINKAKAKNLGGGGSAGVDAEASTDPKTNLDQNEKKIPIIKKRGILTNI